MRRRKLAVPNLPRDMAAKSTKTKPSALTQRNGATNVAMSERFAARRDAAPIVELCLWCDWQWEGPAKDGRVQAQHHRSVWHRNELRTIKRHRRRRMGKWPAEAGEILGLAKVPVRRRDVVGQ